MIRDGLGGIEKTLVTPVMLIIQNVFDIAQSPAVRKPTMTAQRHRTRAEGMPDGQEELQIS